MTWIDVLVEHAHDQIYIVPYRIPIVIFSAVAIYFVFLLLMKIFGSRVLASMSASDAVVIIMFGAVGGRVILGHPPTLATGIIGLATLMAMQALFGILRAKTGIGRILDREPILLMFDGVVVRNGLQKSHFTYDDVRTSLRNAGIGAFAEVQAMILEPSGEVSIIRAGTKLDPEMLRDVRGAEELIAAPKQEPRV
ncbi:MAG TPA: DUF421 domain-containing protein [Corynebacterium stationis]|uniref:DUF421 domain-containing protein n=1 Tax=Corynebacterium stationis TaxID=1705 RepID=UPI001DAEED3E|nr:YetF domain-containing protein [Corynebacterium stationis]HJG65496.1 DUF421 domain-containing protein [Corynebacterium stationis]